MKKISLILMMVLLCMRVSGQEKNEFNKNASVINIFPNYELDYLEIEYKVFKFSREYYIEFKNIVYFVHGFMKVKIMIASKDVIELDFDTDEKAKKFYNTLKYVCNERKNKINFSPHYDVVSK